MVSDLQSIHEIRRFEIRQCLNIRVSVAVNAFILDFGQTSSTRILSPNVDSVNHSENPQCFLVKVELSLV